MAPGPTFFDPTSCKSYMQAEAACDPFEWSGGANLRGGLGSSLDSWMRLKMNSGAKRAKLVVNDCGASTTGIATHRSAAGQIDSSSIFAMIVLFVSRNSCASRGWLRSRLEVLMVRTHRTHMFINPMRVGSSFSRCSYLSVEHLSAKVILSFAAENAWKIRDQSSLRKWL